MLRGLVRPDSDIEQMLLAALTRIGDALVSRARALVRRLHCFAPIRFRESSMIRAHNSG